MEGIIHDVFMANAYYSQFATNTINTDSVDFYTPILEKYGYDVEDLRYTLDRWALKKSSRLSLLIDNATADIQKENQYFLKLEARQKRTDTMLYQRYLDTLLFRPDSLWVRSLKEKDSLIIRMAADEGRYSIRFGYYLSPEDKNNYLVMRYRVRDSHKTAIEANTRSLTRGGKKRIDVTIDTDTKADSLEIILADYPTVAKDIALRVDSILVTYNEPIKKLRERFVKDMIRLELGIDFPYEHDYPPKDSGALYVVPPLRPDTAGHSELR